MADLEGFQELSKKLSELGQGLGGKTLRQSAMNATTATVKKIKESLPVGEHPHKTHKGRLVAPGFASRSVARKSKLSTDKKTVYVYIGVKPEAFYAVAFLELGTRYIPANPVFTNTFEGDKDAILNRFSDQLKKKIEKVRRQS